MAHTTSPEQLLFIELNEFNATLLREAADKHSLQNIRQILHFPHSSTCTDDMEEHQGLDPWVQWVSVHKGMPLSEHGIKRLGDGDGCGHPNLWDILHARGVATACWGIMNTGVDSSLDKTSYCKLHVPDPWSFHAPSIPRKFKHFTGLARYYSQNYVSPSPWQCFKETIKLGTFLIRSPRHWLRPSDMGFIIRILWAQGANSGIFLLLYEFVSCIQFISHNREHRAQLKIFYINSLAHFQHHFWREVDNPDSPMVTCLKAIDRMIGMLLREYGVSHKIVVANAFSQKPFNNGQRILYRQKHHSNFINALGINAVAVRPLMTNDAHLFFSDEAEYRKGIDILSSATINGKPMFQVDTSVAYRQHSNQHSNQERSHQAQSFQFFYQLLIWEALPEDSTFATCKETYDFFQHFEKLHPRTGQHSPHGDIFARGISFPARLKNHEIQKVLLDAFK